MPCAELFFLHGKACAIADVLLDVFALVANDDDRLVVAYFAREIDDIVDQRPSRRAMKHLRDL